MTVVKLTSFNETVFAVFVDGHLDRIIQTLWPEMLPPEIKCHYQGIKMDLEPESFEKITGILIEYSEPSLI